MTYRVLPALWGLMLVGCVGGSLEVETLPDLDRPMNFLSETVEVSVAGGDGERQFSARIDPPGLAAVSIDASGRLSLKGLDAQLGKGEVTVTVSDKTGHASTAFALTVSTYQPQGTFVLDQTWRERWLAPKRYYDFYLPAGFSGARPLVMFLHGGLGSNDALQTVHPDVDDYPARHWLEIADRDGVILAWPNGLGIFNISSNQEPLVWDDCRREAARSNDNSDTLFISAMLDQIIAYPAALQVDTSRVYAVGQSNGGMMAFRLAREMSQRLAAVATFSANEPDGEDCMDPELPVSLMMFSGTSDPNMPYDGGALGSPLLEWALGKVLGAEQTRDLWRGLLDTDPTPDVTAYPDIRTDDDSTLTAYRYRNGLLGSEVVFVRVENGGHTMPSLDHITPSRLERVQNHDVEGQELVWEFFQRHQR